ncbi:RTA1 like protein-domain-containing protein [Bisporella sp. PMI_857]|nr:RTA1 like protein-domain-containing protein [Bisporella sp. PMI_857]
MLPEPHGNATLIENSELCTKALCDLTLSHLDYLPTIGGNSFLAALFAVCFIAQGYLGFKHRTWGFMVAMMLGTLTEVIGYIGRIMMNNNPFSKSNFVIYLTTLTIAPAFLSAAIYLCLARIVVVYGEEKSRFRPRTYTLLFCACDFLSLLLQAVGGAIASSTDTQSGTQTGINIMLAGLGFQVFSLALFATACIEFAYRVYQSSQIPLHPYAQQIRTTTPSSIRSGAALSASLAESRPFRFFLISISVATLVIFIRSIFRVAELSEGFDGKLANDEVSFMILEGAMIAIACITLTVFHPGPCFQGDWRAANFHYRNQKRPEVNRKSFSTSLSALEEEEARVEARGPPIYKESVEDLGNSAVSRVASLRESLRASPSRAEAITGTATTAMPVGPGQVHVEMLPMYGMRYETMSQGPAPAA